MTHGKMSQEQLSQDKMPPPCGQVHESMSRETMSHETVSHGEMSQDQMPPRCGHVRESMSREPQSRGVKVPPPCGQSRETMSTRAKSKGVLSQRETLPKCRMSQRDEIQGTQSQGAMSQPQHEAWTAMRVHFAIPVVVTCSHNRNDTDV